MKGENLARGLGWFSIGLGVAELMAPRQLNRFLGTRSKKLTQAYGLREIATGVGILKQPYAAAWLWARVQGDMLDLATLGAAARKSRRKGGIAFATAAVMGVMALDVLCAKQLSASAQA